MIRTTNLNLRKKPIQKTNDAEPYIKVTNEKFYAEAIRKLKTLNKLEIEGSGILERSYDHSGI